MIMLRVFSYKQQTMGAAYVYPQYLNTEQLAIGKQVNSPNTCPSQSLYREQQEQKQIQPLYIPCFTIRQSPFKSQSQRQQNYLLEKQKQFKLTPASEHTQQISQQQNQQLTVKNIIWSQVLYNNRLLFRILDYLPYSDSTNLALCNKRLSSMLYFYQLFHLPNNWGFTNQHIQAKIAAENKYSFRKIVNEFSFEESEHSLDLDRLQSLFLSQEDLNDQLTRLDRIMKAINATGVSYFQGLNSIIIVLISIFDDEHTYWIALKLLQKTNNIQNQPINYSQLLQKIDKEVKQKSPALYKKLDQFDFNIEYFAMKWVLGLFSSDLSRNVLMYVWDLIINFGVVALKWFIVSLFVYVDELIMDISDADEINYKLKNQLKNYVKGDQASRILQRTRILMCNQLYGQGCSDIFLPWCGYVQEQKTSLNISPGVKQNSNKKIFGIIKQLDYQHENQCQGVAQQEQPVKIQVNIIRPFSSDVQYCSNVAENKRLQQKPLQQKTQQQIQNKITALPSESTTPGIQIHTNTHIQPQNPDNNQQAQ